MNKSTIFVGILAVAALFAAGGSAFFTYMKTKPRAAVSENLGDFDLTQVAGYAVDQKQGDLALELKHELKGGNTTLIWEMAKNKPSGDRQEFDGTWDVLTGGLVYNPKAKALKALEVVIAVDSVVGYGSAHPAPPDLTETLRGNTPGLSAWFDIENHPKAVFTADTFVAKADVPDETAIFDNAPEGWTHLISGKFKLNGEEIELNIPAAVEFIGDKEIAVRMGFQIDRNTFDITGKMIGGWTVEDAAYLTASVESLPKGDALLAALRQQAVEISGNAAQIEDLYQQQNRIEELESQLASIKKEIAKLKETGVAQTPAVDVSSLPKAFTAQVQYPGQDPIPFDMVLVPGEGEVGPFYMAKHEVTWEMFYNWAYGADIDADTYADLQKKNLRPSPLYEDCDQLKLGLGKRPAVSMSRVTAEAFAKWVSEQTGKSFRIPTDAEWQTALKLGGGVPAGRDELFKQAVFLNNAEEQFEPPFLWLSDEVGTKQANALGIHDMLGNAAEWVVDTGADRIVRGGHFMQDLDSEAISADWKSVASQAIWNETYPQEPKSKFWYRDHYYQGIRLVADVE